MIKRILPIILVFIILCCFFVPYSNSEEKDNLEDLKKDAPRVFIDCRRCDKDYIRTEITYVNYVRDRKDADIHVLITSQRTGSGGTEYTMAFIGLENYSDVQNTLTYVANKTNTWDETRKGMVDVLKRGLFPYVLKTPIGEHVFIQFKEKVEPTDVEDKWNFWVFSISMDGRLGGQTTRSSNSINANFSANRVTPELKIRMGFSGNFDEKKYEYDEETIVSKSERKGFNGLFVKSLNEYWSLGSWIEVSSSTYSNIKSLYVFAPAVEYNFFPYSESTRRQLRCLYKIGLNSANYIEETIYEKMSEKLFSESLSTTMEVREQWGNISTSLVGSHFFHDFKKNRVVLRGSVSLRIFKGLFMNVRGRYERIHDQLSLPMEGVTLEEMLLTRKELATKYEYSVSLGLSYTFGSVFSNVVNPRFGNGGRRYY
ncbi:MAG: hypothetical protein U9Q97_06020 [Acidobacteriota bacterium]|nr:hypothetical protein [Acidobacteriota bacterium]